MTELLSYQQAAEFLDPTGEIGITHRTIRRHVAAGRLRKVKIGRSPAVLKADLLSLIETMKERRDPAPQPSSNVTRRRRKGSPDGPAALCGAVGD